MMSIFMEKRNQRTSLVKLNKKCRKYSLKIDSQLAIMTCITKKTCYILRSVLAR